MANKPTPGFWAYDGEDINSDSAHLIAEEMEFEHAGYEIFSVDENGEVNEPVGTAFYESDARLMAAAPRMLAALKECHFFIRKSGVVAPTKISESSIFNTVGSAIFEATGDKKYALKETEKK